MSQRRMFSTKIVDTDAFLDMPISSQALYFHLAMRADDDGFVANPKKIVRMLGNQEDDYKLLIAKKFIIPFESGVCVIKHWLIHNLIRTDRYSETQWVKEKSLLMVDEETKKYSLIAGQNVVIPNGNQMATQYRLGKDRLGKDRKEQMSKLFDQFWIAYPKKVGKAEAHKAFEKINPDDTQTEAIISAIAAHKGSSQWQDNDGRYVPYPATFLNQRRFEDEVEPAKVVRAIKI